MNMRDIIALVEEALTEKVGPAYLYHATTVDDAELILMSNTLEARTTHRVDRGTMSVGFRPGDADQFGTVAGVSLTRDPHFARAWKREGVLFVIDAGKLRQRQRTMPLDYYGKRREAEEFVIGPIKNLEGVLAEIQIGGEVLAWCRDQNEEYIAGHEPYSVLVVHPKLRVVGQSWQNVTGKVL